MSSHRAAKALSSASSEQDHLHVFPKKGTDDNGRQRTTGASDEDMAVGL